MSRYQYVLDEDVLAVVLLARSRDRNVLLRGFEWLSNNPHDTGEKTEFTTSLRPVFTKRFGDWYVTFWQDHLVSEIRIIAVSHLEP